MFSSNTLWDNLQDNDNDNDAREHPCSAGVVKPEVWRVMIVDDDQDIHLTTTLALCNLQMEHRQLEFIHAYSAAEACEVLKYVSDIAVILLNVVIEQPDAGLHPVRHIRETLKLTDVRIILLTDQLGYTPEINAVRDFDIHDYKLKSELTCVKLFTMVSAAIHSYQQIRAIDNNRRGLDRIVLASSRLMAMHGLHDFAAGVLDQVADIVAIGADGVLCMCENADGERLHIIAGAGSLRGLDGVLYVQNDSLATAALTSTLTHQHNIYRPNYFTFFFAGKAGRDFIAFVRLQRALSQFEKRLLDVFCANVAVGFENAELLTHLHNAAFHDPLSKLPNRTRMVEILDATLAGEARDNTVLVLVDLDHFAETNDALGHRFGDQLLVAVAARLESRLARQLTVARIGGDVFCVLGDAAVLNPANILALFEAPFLIDGQDVRVSATLGLVCLSQHEGSGIDALKDADIALKRAKTQQRNGHVYFSCAMGVEIRERVRMMHALRKGFANGELRMVYQPQVDLVSRRPIGAEALLRWECADGTFISPDQFIPIAEYSGLIIDIGEWVLRSAFEELVRLRAAGHSEFTMSVNVSQVQFRHPQFLNMLLSALHDTQAPPAYIELEITESVAMEEPDLQIKMLEQIKQTGISIAIDDFGTGFSSLCYLQRLNVDRLKIDRVFIAEITSSARGSSIAEMVIQLGRSLGLTVVAEGVEDQRQAQVLQALGCPLAQGFLFARPMQAQELYSWLATDCIWVADANAVG